MDLYSAIIILILVMDPLGNIPVFLTILNTVPEEKRIFFTIRESIIAFLILTGFLFFGKYILHGLNITEPALGIAGGIILFLIAIKMIFPASDQQLRERQIGEPFIVPLAIPLLAGPSSLATVLLFATRRPAQMGEWFLALVFASLITTFILLVANHLRQWLGQKGLVAVERLMGMILTTIAVQMFLNGIDEYFHLTR